MDSVIDLAGLNILIVEDDDMNFIYLTQIMKMTNGTHTRVKTGREALAVFYDSQFDLILMDIQLPDTTGIDVTTKIRETHKDVCIIAQTASRSSNELDECLQCGCNAVLTKPFKLHEFSDVVSQAMDLN